MNLTDPLLFANILPSLMELNYRFRITANQAIDLLNNHEKIGKFYFQMDNRDNLEVLNQDQIDFSKHSG